MNNDKYFSLQVKKTRAKCPIGELIGKRNLDEGSTPVLSCEGACIRGEIARQAANMLAKEEGFRRGCHGELLAVPDSAMADWSMNAEKVILIDGCFLRCHGRIMENLIDENKLIQFDAYGYYKRYSDLFDIDSVPETERLEVARDVVNWVLATLRKEEKKRA